VTNAANSLVFLDFPVAILSFTVRFHLITAIPWVRMNLISIPRTIANRFHRDGQQNLSLFLDLAISVPYCRERRESVESLGALRVDISSRAANIQVPVDPVAHRGADMIACHREFFFYGVVIFAGDSGGIEPSAVERFLCGHHLGCPC
jgi:hypothetical protein